MRQVIEVECGHCHEKFSNTNNRIQDALTRSKSGLIFCSRKCFKNYWDTRREVSCNQCGNPILRSKSAINPTNFCTPTCSATYWNKHRKWGWGPKDRERLSILAKKNNAAKNFIDSSGKPRSYAGNPKGPRVERVIIVCKECNTEFSVIPSSSSRKHCGTKCSRKNSYHPNSSRLKQGKYKGAKMDSGAEFYFAQLLDENNIAWEKNETKYYIFSHMTPVFKFNSKIMKYNS